ncbi:hypothetical protein [Salinisphaera sp. LB1]|nr:hypothetical protein [Salinisphaera sp. LB1]
MPRTRQIRTATPVAAAAGTAADTVGNNRHDDFAHNRRTAPRRG